MQVLLAKLLLILCSIKTHSKWKIIQKNCEDLALDYEVSQKCKPLKVDLKI